ncbi:hypothetical protein AAF712_015771 [Marasmius tenuissimus]|uniref:Uncharacterized protein n=1 Tax=Marasmius tenuissimus TaxID=585030 RepID=A0ABR2Z9K3_9AGAR
MAPVTLAPYQQKAKILGGNNNNNFANGVQNIHKGRDFLQNNFTGQINVNNRGRDDSDDDDDNGDRPFPPRKFQKELKLFKQQYPKVSDNNVFEKADSPPHQLILSDLPDKAKSTQLSSYRELLDAHRQMKTNTNRLEEWRNQQSNATYHQTFNNTTQSGSKNYHNFASGVQNFYKGRDFNQNSGAGRIVVNYNIQGDVDEDDGDRPLSLERFQKELKIFKCLYPKLNDNELKKIHGQEHSERWRPLTISDLPGKTSFPSHKTDIVDVLERPDVSGLSPKCLRIQHVGIEDLDLVPNAQSPDVKVPKGNVGTADVIAKVPEQELGPDEERLKMPLKDAITWRKLSHSNLLFFLFLYYVDRFFSRICLYSCMGQAGVGESEPGESEERSEVKKPADVDLDRFTKSAINDPKYVRDFRGVIHGDFQKASFLIDSPVVARIAEPGLAQILSKATDETLLSCSDQCTRVLYYKMHDGGDTKRLENPPT